MADGTKQYVVEYVVAADISQASAQLTQLTSMMSAFQNNYGASIRQTSTAADRILKSAKTIGKNLGKQLDMSGPIAQMQAFQTQLVRTFAEAHKTIGSMFAGDLKSMQRNIDNLNNGMFMSGRAMDTVKNGAKSSASEIRKLNQDVKNAQSSLTSMSNLYQRFANAKVGTGNKAKLSAAALKTFTDDERKAISKFTNDKTWMTAYGDRLNKAVETFKQNVTSATGILGTKKAALEKALSDNKAKYGVAQSASVAASPLLMSAEDMDKKVAATRKMVRSMSKIIADQKGKPRTINYTVNLRIEDATAKLQLLNEKLAELQAKANISVRVKGAGAAKTFKGYISDIQSGITGLKTSLNEVATGSFLQTGKKGKGAGIQTKLSFDKNAILKQISGLKGAQIPVMLKPSLGANAKEKEKVVQQITKGIPKIQLRLDASAARATLNRFINSINRVRNQVINLTATAGATFTSGRVSAGGTTTTQGAAQTTGTTSTQPTAGRTPPRARRGMQGTRKQMMRSSAYPLVGNTSFGVQTPAFVSMAKGMVGMMGIGAAFGLIGDAMSQAVDYQNTMMSVKAILEANKRYTGYTPENFRAMEKNIRQVGMDTKFTAPEVAGAARFMAMAGLSVDQINRSIRPIADVALIGDNDLETTADKITNIQTAFKLGKDAQSMRRLADHLTTTFTRFNTDMMMTAEAMQYAAPVASAAGLGIEDTLAMIGVMGNAGIQSSMAGTTLRMAMQNIIKPNKRQKELWDKLGISRYNADKSPRNIVEVLTELRSKASDAQLMEIVSNLFRTTSMAGTVQIIRNLDLLNSARQDMLLNRDAGLSSRLSAEKQNTVKGLWAQVTSAFTEDNVVMFEKFQGKLKDMLISIRDYLRTPQAVQNLENVMELVKTMGGAFGTVAKIWMDVYNTFPGAVRAFMVIQFALSQIGMLLNPFIGLFRVLRNAGTFLGVSGAAGVAGATGAAGKLAGFASGAVASRYIGRYGLGAFTGRTFGNAFTAARSAGALSFSGVASAGLSGLGTIIGSIFSPIGISLMTIAGTTLAIKKIMSDRDKVDKAQEKTRKAMQPKLYELSKNGFDKRYFDTFESSVRQNIPGYIGPSSLSIKDRLAGITSRRPVRKIAVPTLRALEASGLLTTDFGWTTSADTKRSAFWNTYINPIKNDSILGGILKPHLGLLDEDNSETYRKVSAISSIIREGGTSDRVSKVRQQILSLLSSAAFSKDPNAMKNAMSKARGLISNFEQIGLQTATMDAGNASFDQMANSSPMRFKQYWDAGLAVLNDLVNNPENKYVRQLMAIKEHAGLGNMGLDAWFKNMDDILSSVGINIDGTIHSLDFKNGVPQFDKLSDKLRELGVAFNGSLNARIMMLQDISNSLNNIPGMSDIIDKIQSTIDQLNTIKNLGFNEFMKQYYNIDVEGYLRDAVGDKFHKIEMTPDQAGAPVPYKPVPLKAGQGKLFEWGSDEKAAPWISPVDKVSEMKQKMDKATKIDNPSSKMNEITDPNKKNGGNHVPKPGEYTTDQSGYANNYQRSAARPTQVNFSIQNLINFDKTEFKTMDQQEVARNLEFVVSQAAAQLAATAASQLSALGSANGDTQEMG